MTGLGKRQRRLPPLNALRAFEMASRHLSFSVAGAELSVTQSAISRQIKALEDYLGVELFKRLPRSLELTDTGARYAASLHESFDQLYRATEAMMDQHKVLTLNINVLPTFAMKWLIPRLLHFTAANPSIEVRITTSIRPADFRMDDNDVAIRVAPYAQCASRMESPIDLVMTQSWSDVRSAPFLSDTLIAVCAPKLLENGPPIKSPADLRKHKLLHVATREKAWPYWLEKRGLDPASFTDYTAFGHFFMAQQAAVEGKGIALIPRIFLDSELESGALIEVFPGQELLAGAYYFLCKESNWNNVKVERFRKWLMEEASLMSGFLAKEWTTSLKSKKNELRLVEPEPAPAALKSRLR